MERNKKEISYTAQMAEEHRIKAQVRQHLYAQYNHVRFTVGKYPVLIAPFGSWNYGLQHEGSDMDSYAYMAPSYEDLIFGKKEISQEIGFKLNEEVPADIISTKSLSDLFKGVAAGSPTALEIINSPHQMFSPCEFGEYHKKLQGLSAEVEMKMPFRVLMNLVKMGQNNLKRASGVQLEYNPEKKKKQILTAFRAVAMIETYMAGKSYYQMLISSVPEESGYKKAKFWMEQNEENVRLAWNMAYGRLEHLERNIHELYGSVPQQVEWELEDKGKALWRSYVTEKIVIRALQGEYVLP